MLIHTTTQAQITLDGTVGPQGTLTGPDYLISDDLGQQVGSNLFHSFDEFNVNTGESATFTGPDAINNVIGRITGGLNSNIDGTITSTMPDADVFLINPAGFVFGPNAQLDVPGSFHVSTADYLTLEDGGRFDARDPASSSLTVAPVAAFGFLGDSPAGINVNGSLLQVNEGEHLSVISGDITVVDGFLVAPDGRIDIAAVASAGEVRSTDAGLELNGFADLGAIEFVQVDADLASVPFFGIGNLDTSGDGGGAIFIRGGELSLDAGIIASNTNGAGEGQGIDIDIKGKLSLDNSSLITAHPTVGTGNGGDITVRAGDLTIRNGNGISTSTFSAGDAGNLLVEAERITIDGVDGTGSVFGTGLASAVGPGSTGKGGELTVWTSDLVIRGNEGFISTSTFGAGDSGNLLVEAERITIDGAEITIDGMGMGIVSTALLGSTGKGGELTVRTDDLVILNGGQISSGTLGAGDAGNLLVEAERITIDGTSGLFITGLISAAAPGSTGKGGDLTVRTDDLAIHNGGQINASTFSDGDAGNLLVEAKRITLDRGRLLSIAAPGSTGNGGELTVRAEDLTIRNNGLISADTLSIGDAGNLLVEAKRITIDGAGTELFTGLTSEAERGSTGKGGELTIRAENLTIRDGGKIGTRTLSEGDGGNLLVEAERITIDGAEDRTEFGTGLFSGATSDSTGKGGTITVRTDDLAIHNGGNISTEAFSEGAGGMIDIAANTIHLSEDSSITASSTEISENAGVAGDIILTTSLLRLNDSSVISSQSESAGGGVITINGDSVQLFEDSAISTAVAGGPDSNAGDITINGDNLVLLNQGAITATAIEGRGGRIVINSNVFLRESEQNIVSAVSGVSGNDGTVEVNSPELDISGSLINLDISFFDAASLLNNRCGNRTAETASSFTIAGRGGIPTAPEDWLLSAPSTNAFELMTDRADSQTYDQPFGSELPVLAALDIGCD